MRSFRIFLAPVVALLGLVGCTQPHIPKEDPLPPAGQSAPDWNAVFASPRSIEVIPLVTGEINVERSILLNLDDPRVEDQDDRKIWVPVLAYLVRHEEHGDFLVDAGFDSSFSRSSHGNFGGMARFVEIGRQPEGGDTASLLRRTGVDPTTLRMIVISHLHLDHVAGLPELPKTVPLYAGPQARLGYETMWYAPTDHLAGFDSIRTWSFDGLPDAGPGPSIDVFGDGSFFAISAPGHTTGNLSFIVNGRRGPVLLTCDASHLQVGFRTNVSPGFAQDRKAADATIQRLHSFANEHPSLRVFVGHDAADWDMSRSIQDPL